MANANRPAGLVPLEYSDGSPWNGKCRQYYIASNNGVAFAIGDPVTLTGTGDANGIAGVTVASAGTGSVVLGAVVGFGGPKYGGPSATPGALETSVIPATKSAAYYVLVADDPNIIFSIQEIGTGTALAATDIGSNANLSSGTNNGYVSGWLLDNSGLATTSTLQLRLLGLVQTTQADNAYGAYAKWRVQINNHQYAAGVTGV